MAFIKQIGEASLSKNDPGPKEQGFCAGLYSPLQCFQGIDILTGTFPKSIGHDTAVNRDTWPQIK